MRQGLERYAVEITIALLGVGTATLEAVFASRTDIALLMVVGSFLLALAVAAIRQDMTERLSKVTLEGQILAAIPDARWREEAAAELDRLRLSFSGWSDGSRRVPEHSSLNFQIRSLGSASESIRAIHVAVHPLALAMWDDRHRGYDRMVDAYRGLPDALAKKRILVLDWTDENLSKPNGSGRLITDPVACRVCNLQMVPQNEGGLGFELRILWLKPSDEVPPNLLIVDAREACSIENKGEDRFTDLEVSVNPTLVQYQVRRFEDLWTRSVPAEHCVPVTS